MSQLTLIYGNKNYSSWSLRPWLLMKQFGLEFEEIRVALFTDEATKVLESRNSDKKVPLLLDGELEIWDSLAILEYVSETYLDGKGWPLAPAARAHARSISAEMHSSFMNVRNELPMNCRNSFTHVVPSPGAQKEIERIQSLWRNCRELYAQQGPYLFGEFSIADAMYAPIALRFTGYNITLGEVEQAYVEQLLSLPALQQWVEDGKKEIEIIEEDEV